MDHTKQLSELAQAFDRRQQSMNQHTAEIATILSPTLLTALFELMELTHEQVVWEDFNLQGTALVVKVSVTYSPLHNTSLFLELLLPPETNVEVASVTQQIVFGVPLDVVFMEKDKLKQWCMDVVHTQQSSDTVYIDETYSQPPDLTKEQLAQILHFKRIYTTEQ